MRTCIKTLPHTLVVHLKRFEFDYETMTRFKIRDRFEFPAILDMYRYTVEGMAEAEEATEARARGNCVLHGIDRIQFVLYGMQNRNFAPYMSLRTPACCPSPGRSSVRLSIYPSISQVRAVPVAQRGPSLLLY
jgi:Ubiquitin carboxyl-terminal hydrolase